MSDFFKELEDEIREERIVVLWRKYGNYIIALAVLIVLVTAGYSIWNYVSLKIRTKEHMHFAEAVRLMNAGKKEEALKEFQAFEGKDGYSKLAKLYIAALSQNPEVLYTQIATEYTSDPALGNLAKVLKASHELGNTDALTSLEPLTAPQNAWAPLSLELLALADLKKGDDAKAAERYLRILKEPSITQNEQIRAGMMLSQIDIPAFLLEKEVKKEAQQ